MGMGKSNCRVIVHSQTEDWVDAVINIHFGDESINTDSPALSRSHYLGLKDAATTSRSAWDTYVEGLGTAWETWYDGLPLDACRTAVYSGFKWL